MSNTSAKKLRPIVLWGSEDALANWIGFIIIAVGAYSVLSGAFDFSAATFSTWCNGTNLSEQFNAVLFTKLARTYIVLAVLFTIGAALKKENPFRFLTAFPALFILAILVRVISAEYTFNRYLEWAFFALILDIYYIKHARSSLMAETCSPYGILHQNRAYKSIQNILIGFIAFAVAVFFATFIRKIFPDTEYCSLSHE